MSEDSEEYEQQYKKDSLEQQEQVQQTQSMSNENYKIVQDAKANQELKRPDGWKTNDGSFWNWSNYETLPLDYKEFIPKKQTKTKRYPNGEIDPIIHEDPFDKKTYMYGVTFFDTGGTSVWSRLHVPRTTGFKKAYFKTIDVIEGTAKEIRTHLAASNEERGNKSYKYVQPFQIKEMTTNADGSKTLSDKIIHVLLLQERIEYG